MRLLIVLSLAALAFGDGHGGGESEDHDDGPKPELRGGVREGGPGPTNGARPENGRQGEGMGHGPVGGWPKPCCFPDLLAGDMVETTGYMDDRGNYDESKTTRKFHVDFAAGKMAGLETIEKEMRVVYNSTFVLDFNKQYFKAQDSKSKECSWFKVPTPLFRQCISKRAKFDMTTHVGAGDDKADINVFSMEVGEKENQMWMSVGVTADKCVPVFIKIKGQLKGGEMGFKMEKRFWGMKDEFESTPEKFDYTNVLPTCQEFKELPTPDAYWGNKYLVDQFFPMTAPRKCCFPKAWEGSVGYTNATVLNGNPTLITTHVPHMAVNFEYKKFASTMYVYTDGVPTMNMTFIGNLVYGTLYGIDLTSKECKRFNIPSASKMGGECVPSTAEHVGDITLGPMEGGLDTTIWKIDQGEGLYKELTVTHSDGKCVPVAESVTGPGWYANGGYYDMRGDVKDPDVFTPPAACDGVEAEDMPAEVEVLIGGMIRKFSKSDM